MTKRTALLALLLAACTRESGTPAPPPTTSPIPAAEPSPQTAAGAASSTHPSPSASSSPDAGRAPLSVVLISIDSLRADEVPWLGYARDTAPNLTALSKHATIYPHAYSISSFTSKSLPATLASKFPSEMTRDGVFFTTYKPAKNMPDNVMLCDLLSTENVPCVAGMAHAYLAKGYAGIDHGFQRWELVPGITFDYNTDPYVTSQKLEPLAEELLGDAKLTSGPFFAWFHFMDPHDVYQSHVESTHWGHNLKDRYDEEIVYTDLWVGKLIDFIEHATWGAHTAIIVTADHGEAFGEHQKWKHAQELYETHIHVPLLVYVPGQPGRTIDAYRSAIDLAPTIMELVGSHAGPTMDGKSYAPELFGAPPDVRDVVADLPQDEYNDHRRTLIHDGVKIIAFGNDARYALYRLADDPMELHDLYAKETSLAADMTARYKAASAALKDVPPVGGIPHHD